MQQKSLRVIRCNPPEQQNPEIKANYIKQCKIANKVVTTTKCSYFRNMILQNQNSPKQLWATLDSLLGRTIPKSLPSTNSPSALATSFLNFFEDKITKLCHTIPSNVNSIYTIVPSNMPSLLYCQILNLLLSKRYIILYFPPLTHLVSLMLSPLNYWNLVSMLLLFPLPNWLTFHS